MTVPFKPRTVHPLAQSIQPLIYACSIKTPDGPSSSPVNTPTILCLFHSNPGRSMPQPSQYTHYSMSFPFKPRTVHPPAQSLQPLRYACSIQTSDYPTSSPVITPITLCLFHSNPGRCIPHPSQYTHYSMPVPFKPRTVHSPAQSLHALLYASTIQTTDGPYPSPVNTPTKICWFHSNPGRSISQPKHYIRYAMPVPFNNGCKPVETLNYLSNKKSKGHSQWPFGFGTVPVRYLLSRCFHLNSNIFQTDKLIVSPQLLILCWKIRT